MKKSLWYLPMFAIALCSPFERVFATQVSKEKSWAGEFYLIPTIVSQKSQFTAENENRQTSDLNNSGKTTDIYGVLPMVRIDYKPEGSPINFIFGTSRENVTKGQIAIEFGISYSLNNETKLTVAAFPELPFSGETWADPYLTGQDRKKTDERASGGRIKFEHAGDSNFDVQYAFSKNKIENEESGNSLNMLNASMREMLNRDADFHRFNVNMQFPIGENFMFSPGIQVTTSEAKGDANDFSEGTLIMQSTYFSRSHVLSATFRIGRMESRVKNPIFNLQQNDRTFSFDAFYKYSEPLGYKDWDVLTAVFWKKDDSNISFYDKQMLGVGIGVGYKW